MNAGSPPSDCCVHVRQTGVANERRSGRPPKQRPHLRSFSTPACPKRTQVHRQPFGGWFNHCHAVRPVSHEDLVLFGRVGLAFLLCYAVGFERAIRGAAAGDRTFALVGTAAAAITAVTLGPAPQAIGGVVTGVGFIGAGLVLRGGMGMVRGITSASAVFAATGVGVVAGAGHAWLAVFVTLLTLLDLELRHLPVLSRLEAHRYSDRMANDPEDNAEPSDGPGPFG
jgi:putative Mg2+ transporter-C (MgtC) family protein